MGPRPMRFPIRQVYDGERVSSLGTIDVIIRLRIINSGARVVGNGWSMVVFARIGLGREFRVLRFGANKCDVSL